MSAVGRLIPKLQSTGVRSLLSIGVLVQVQSQCASGASESRPKGRCSKQCGNGPFTLASLLCLMAYRECCRQALPNPKLQSTGVGLCCHRCARASDQSQCASGASESRPKGRCSKQCGNGPFTLASLLCLMAYRECCRQALPNPKLQSTGVRSLLSIGVLVQVIRANVRAGQVKADPRVGAASTAVVGPLP